MDLPFHIDERLSANSCERKYLSKDAEGLSVTRLEQEDPRSFLYRCTRYRLCGCGSVTTVSEELIRSHQSPYVTFGSCTRTTCSKHHPHSTMLFSTNWKQPLIVVSTDGNSTTPARLQSVFRSNITSDPANAPRRTVQHTSRRSRQSLTALRKVSWAAFVYLLESPIRAKVLVVSTRYHNAHSGKSLRDPILARTDPNSTLDCECRCEMRTMVLLHLLLVVSASAKTRDRPQ